jgi:hypothetical protein
MCVLYVPGCILSFYRQALSTISFVSAASVTPCGEHTVILAYVHHSSQCLYIRVADRDQSFQSGPMDRKYVSFTH